MREMWDQPRAFRPIVPGHFSHMTQQNEGPCDSPRARMSPKPKSQAQGRRYREGQGGHGPLVFKRRGAISNFGPPKVKKKIAETAQGVVWIKRNVITNHIM